MVYRAVGGDLRDVVPVVAVQRSSALQAPLVFPSPAGRYVALLQPLVMGYASNLNGAALSVFSTDGHSLASVGSRAPLLDVTGSRASGRTLALHVTSADQVIWSRDSRYVYYHSGAASQQLLVSHTAYTRPYLNLSGYDEIHRVDMAGHDVTLYHQPTGQNSLRLVGLDHAGNLILTLARPHMPVALLRLATKAANVSTTAAAMPTGCSTIKVITSAWALPR